MSLEQRNIGNRKLDRPQGLGQVAQLPTDTRCQDERLPHPTPSPNRSSATPARRRSSARSRFASEGRRASQVEGVDKSTCREQPALFKPCTACIDERTCFLPRCPIAAGNLHALPWPVSERPSLPDSGPNPSIAMSVVETKEPPSEGHYHHDHQLARSFGRYPQPCRYPSCGSSSFSPSYPTCKTAFFGNLKGRNSDLSPSPNSRTVWSRNVVNVTSSLLFQPAVQSEADRDWSSIRIPASRPRCRKRTGAWPAR
mgnify:CR=1 FL=1